MLPKSFLNNYLTVVLVLAFGIATAQSECKEIKATIEVFGAGQKSEKPLVTIDFHDQPQSLLVITLLGVKGFSQMEIKEKEIKNLNKGKYMLVFTSRREEDGFCIKHVEFTIK
jgi:hypothetical protein